MQNPGRFSRPRLMISPSRYSPSWKRCGSFLVSGLAHTGDMFHEYGGDCMTVNWSERSLISTGQEAQTGLQRGLKWLTNVATLIFTRAGGVAR